MTTHRIRKNLLVWKEVFVIYILSEPLAVLCSFQRVLLLGVKTVQSPGNPAFVGLWRTWNRRKFLEFHPKVLEGKMIILGFFFREHRCEINWKWNKKNPRKFILEICCWNSEKSQNVCVGTLTVSWAGFVGEDRPVSWKNVNSFGYWFYEIVFLTLQDGEAAADGYGAATPKNKAAPSDPDENFHDISVKYRWEARQLLWRADWRL